MQELEASMTAAEFGDWMALYAVEPWGEWRGDLQAGVVAATVANCNRGKDAPPFKPGDFIPRLAGDARETGPEPDSVDPADWIRQLGH